MNADCPIRGDTNGDDVEHRATDEVAELLEQSGSAPRGLAS